MSTSQEPDQVTYSFLFIITPLDIISTKSIKNLKKSLLLKLGDRTEKTSQLNKPIQIPVDVLYSKTLKKYCPIKGIIKVYDINLDGSEVISSVGGFQTEEILNQQKKNVIIERDVGTSKIKMKIQIQNLGTVKGKTQNGFKAESVKIQSVTKQQNKSPLARSQIRENTNEVLPMTLQKSRIMQSNTHRNDFSTEDEIKKYKNPQFIRRSTPIPSVSTLLAVKTRENKNNELDAIKDQTQNISQYSFNNKTTVQLTQNTYKSIQTKKYGIVCPQSNRLKKSKDEISSDQIVIIKQMIEKSKKEREKVIQQFDQVVNGLDTKNGNILIQNNQKDKILSLKYKETGFERIFNKFLEFMVFQLSKPIKIQNFLEQEQNVPSLETKHQKEVKELTEQLSRKTNEIFTLRAKDRQKFSSEPLQQQELLTLTSKIKELQNINKTLKEQNNYLKQKDQTMQQIITEKQNEIENLKQQITEIDLQFKEMECALKNDACEIQELKEEVSNLNQVIQNYREKYGDLKNLKNRALQNQLKECLIWIDQQTRSLEMSDFDEQTEPSHSHNVSEIIKNIELEGASRQEMKSIKIELAGLITRIDNFLTK